MQLALIPQSVGFAVEYVTTFLWMQPEPGYADPLPGGLTALPADPLEWYRLKASTVSSLAHYSHLTNPKPLADNRGMKVSEPEPNSERLVTETL